MSGRVGEWEGGWCCEEGERRQRKMRKRAKRESRGWARGRSRGELVGRWVDRMGSGIRRRRGGKRGVMKGYISYDRGYEM
jgi:hypothetical protein